jgi:hypothetical protein
VADSPRGSANRSGTLAEAVARILVTFGEAEFAEWADKPMDEATTAHFDLGLWIRNHWVCGTVAPLVARIKELDRRIHDDDIPALILEGLWRVLNDGDCPTVEGLLARRHGMPGAAP